MRVGDVLEAIGGGCAVAASLVATNRAWVGLLVAAVFLLYLGQCYGASTLPFSRPAWLRWKRQNPDIEPVSENSDELPYGSRGEHFADEIREHDEAVRAAAQQPLRAVRR